MIIYLGIENMLYLKNMERLPKMKVKVYFL
jgi:hypothetical protein